MLAPRLALRIAPIVAAAFLAGCTVGPNYQRPALPAPLSFRAPEGTATSDSTSLGDLKWFEVFKDERLQELERTALEQNYDLREAAARIEAAGASLGDAVRMTIYVTDMGQFASVNEVYGSFFESDPPARVTVGVSALPRGAQVEIDAVVAVPD